MLNHWIIALAALLVTPPGRLAEPLPGEQVIRDAYKRYGGKWFNTVEVVQRTVFPMEGRMETWYVAIQPPGLMRVDVAPGVTGRALIYRNDSTYQFGRGQLRVARPEVQPLMVLLHDVHSARPDRTIAMLKRFGFDLRKTHERVWDGERVVVVGALAGDTVSNQFWFEKKRMVLVRLLERNAADPARPLDARITGYQRAGAGWIEHSVRMFLGGQLSTVEDYGNVAVDKPLEAGIFNPVPYRLPQWVKGANDIFGHVPNSVPAPPH